MLEQVPDARLLIVGSRPDLEWAENIPGRWGSRRMSNSRDTLQMSPNIWFGLTLHVLTSEFEGWCLALGEAWATVFRRSCSNCRISNMFRAEKSYVAVEMLHISRWPNAVVKLLLDASVRKKMGREAREVIEEFDQVSVKEEWPEDISRYREQGRPRCSLASKGRIASAQGSFHCSWGSLPESQDSYGDNYVPVLPSNARCNCRAGGAHEAA